MRVVSRLCEFNPRIYLTNEEKAQKNLSQGSRRVLVYILHITKTPTKLLYPHIQTPTVWGTVYWGCRTWFESWSDHHLFWLMLSLPHCPSKLWQITFKWATVQLWTSITLTSSLFTTTFSTLSPNSFYRSGAEFLTLMRLNTSPVLPSIILEQF